MISVFCVISIPVSLVVALSAMLEEARLRAATAGQPAVTSEDGGGTMDLEARSPVVAIATKSLSQAQTARLVAAECYRHKLDHMVLTTHCTILWRTSAAEGFWDALCAGRVGWKWLELRGPITETILKRLAIERQMIDLGGEKCRALAEASLSVLGTVTLGEWRCVTQAVGPQDFKDGAVLIKEGEPRDALFIIVEGQVSFTQRRHHRYEVGPARAALGAPQRASARHASAPVLRPARLAVCSSARGPI